MDLLRNHSVLPNIFSYLPPEDLFSCMLVNAEFYYEIDRNWNKMKRHKAKLSIRKHSDGLDLKIIFFPKNLHSILIREKQIQFTAGLEGLAVLMKRKRGELQNNNVFEQILSIESHLSGLKEVLHCLLRRLHISALFLYPTSKLIDMHDTPVVPFSSQQLLVIRDCFKRFRLPHVRLVLSPMNGILASIMKDCATNRLKILKTNSSLLSLDTSTAKITIECIWIYFAPFQLMIQEWMRGERTIFHLEAITIGKPGKLISFDDIFDWCQSQNFRTESAFRGHIKIEKSSTESMEIYDTQLSIRLKSLVNSPK